MRSTTSKGQISNRISRESRPSVQSRYFNTPTSEHGVEFDVNDDENQGEDKFEEEEKLPPKIADVDVASAQPLSCAS